MARIQVNFEGDLCEKCGENPKARCGYHDDGTPKFRNICNTCHKIRYRSPWLKFRGDHCDSCGYEPMFMRSLEVHHRDGDKSNNEEYNLRTLCSNCHRELEGLIFELEGDSNKAESLLARFIKRYFR